MKKKKKVLRVFAGATLMLVMAIGIQTYNGSNDSSLVMKSLMTMAIANDSESGNCTKYCCEGAHVTCMGSNVVTGTVVSSGPCDTHDCGF